MGKKAIIAFLALSMLPALASAQLEIKNQRVTHGPMGATRTETKFLPGDYLFIAFDMDGLKFDPQTGKASYQTILELYNSTDKKPIFTKNTDNVVAPMLGGTRIPGDLHVIMGTDQPPGRYVVRLIVVDKATKKFAFFDHRFELLPQDFGLVGVTAPAIGFPGQHYLASFALVNMKLNASGMPNAEVNMRVLDERGAVEMTRAIKTSLPKDMPDPKDPKEKIDLKKENFVPMQFPIYLNRPGRFVIEIQATDANSNKQARLRYVLNVVDLETLIGR